MSTQLLRAIGYGMPYDQFVAASLIKPEEGESFSSALYDAFGRMTPETTIVSKFYRDSVPDFCPYWSLLTEKLDPRGKAGKFCKGHDLFELIGYDEYSDIVFFPDGTFTQKWRHRDDDVDYAFEKWRDGGKRAEQAEPRVFVTYVEYGHYPYTNNLMNARGDTIKWDHFIEVEKHPEWVPAVPSTLRWLLTNHEILSYADTLKLRPLIAQWWS